MFDTGRSWDSAGSRDPNEPITSQQEKNRFAIIRFAVVREIQILTVFSHTEKIVRVFIYSFIA
jgi:hypothetical protein